MSTTRKRKFTAVEEPLVNVSEIKKTKIHDITKTDKFWISQNKLYMIYISDPDVLYVRTNINVLQRIRNNALREQLRQMDPNESYPKVPGYNMFYFVSKFEEYGKLTRVPRETDNDCLQLAESIVSAKVGQSRFFYRGKNPQLREIHTKKLFGDSLNKNIKLAIDIKTHFPNEVNDLANPKIGEVYAQVLAESGHTDEFERPPYHISTVILKDGDSNITIEANAVDTSLDSPIFAMYSTIPDSAYTFHKMDTDMFEADDPENIITIVLESIYTQEVVSGGRKNKTRLRFSRKIKHPILN